MRKIRKPNGFGGVEQVAEFFDLPEGEVNDKADRGERERFDKEVQRLLA